MRYPSVKTIETMLEVDRPTAKVIQQLMKGELDPYIFAEVRAWVRQCYHTPPDHDLQLKAIDEVLDTCGIAGLSPGDVTHPRSAKGDWVSYCNTGDSYAPTVAYSTANGQWYVAHWAYFVGD